MRIRRLSPVAAAAGLLMALMPAGTLASGHPSPGGRCNINLNVAPRRITAGDALVVFGRLLCERPAAEAGQTVKLFEDSFGEPRYALAQSATTGARGF